MKCSIEGCDGESDGEPEGSKEYNLCPKHYDAWGYFLAGYVRASGKDDGRLRRSLWNKAMVEFLESCRVEIEACNKLAMARLLSEE